MAWNFRNQMRTVELAVLVALWLGCAGAQSGDEAYPGLGLDSCGMRSSSNGGERKVITDLTHEMRRDLPSWLDKFPVEDGGRLVESMRNGSQANISEMKMIVHTGTHVDAPGHFLNDYYEAGFDVNGLDLDILVGPVITVDTPRDSNITARVLADLNIPAGTQRVLFRTANTDKRLMWYPKFVSDFIGFTEDGAEWLVTHRPEVKLIGIDYLSIAAIEQNRAVHEVLLGKKLILVEGLNMDGVPVGNSQLYCLPPRLLKAEGSPIRCILID